MTNISMNIPGDRTKHPSINQPLAQLNALEDPKLSDPSTLRFAINAIGEKYLNVNSKTGEVVLSKEFSETNVKGKNFTLSQVQVLKGT